VARRARSLVCRKLDDADYGEAPTTTSIRQNVFQTGYVLRVGKLD
jgi:hypothetical protein